MLGAFNAAWYIILERAVMYPVAPPLFIRVSETLRAPVIVLLEINSEYPWTPDWDGTSPLTPTDASLKTGDIVWR